MTRQTEVVTQETTVNKHSVEALLGDRAAQRFGQAAQPATCLFDSKQRRLGPIEGPLSHLPQELLVVKAIEVQAILAPLTTWVPLGVLEGEDPQVQGIPQVPAGIGEVACKVHHAVNQGACESR